MENKILQGLNPEQQKAVNHSNGPLLILAGAGTGKTRTITAKIARLIKEGTPPWRILAVTFTNKAAREMKERIETLVPGNGSKVWMYTFHSFANRILRQHAKLLKLNPDFLIYGENEQKKIITEILKELRLDKDKSKAKMYLSIISRAKDELLDEGSYKIHANASGADYKITLSQVYTLYQRKLDKMGALDFGDLLLKTALLLKENEQVRSYYQDYFRYVLVDEYQDTNHAQYVITKTLAAKHKNITVVGDPDQSIYSWRGADIRNIMEFEQDFPNAEIITLEQNYRSTANILQSADNVIKNNITRKPKQLTAVKSKGDPVCVQELSTETQEAAWTAQTVEKLVNEEGYTLNEIAVFYRTNAQSRVFEDVFRRKQIPYRLIGSSRFYERAEIRDALAYLKLLINPADDVSLARIINVPRRGIGAGSFEKIVSFAKEKNISVFEALKNLSEINIPPAARKAVESFKQIFEKISENIKEESPSLICEKILTLSGYLDHLQNEAEKDSQNLSRLNNLQELVNALKEYEERMQKQKTPPSIAGYLQETALITADEGYDADTSAVTLMTVHLAKGLEFDAVFATGLEEGLFPINIGQETTEELEEERRLCYVAMTRARKHLFLTYASTRRRFGKMYSNLPSRFLFESKLLESEPIKTPSYDFTPAPQITPTTTKKTRVRHSVYGTGRIISKTGSGEKTKVRVMFDKGGMQTFMLKYAPLEFI